MSAFKNRHELIYRGEPTPVIGRLATFGAGIGLFTRAELDIVTGALTSSGYVQEETGSSSSRAKLKVGLGEVHSHDYGGLIVHRTETGSGTARFFWPADEELNAFYASDIVRLTAEETMAQMSTETPFDPDTVIVFPTHSWHQFNTDPNQDRRSVFTYHYPVSAE